MAGTDESLPAEPEQHRHCRASSAREQNGHLRRVFSLESSSGCVSSQATSAWIAEAARTLPSKAVGRSHIMIRKARRSLHNLLLEGHSLWPRWLCSRCHKTDVHVVPVEHMLPCLEEGPQLSLHTWHETTSVSGNQAVTPGQVADLSVHAVHIRSLAASPCETLQIFGL